MTVSPQTMLAVELQPRSARAPAKARPPRRTTPAVESAPVRLVDDDPAARRRGFLATLRPFIGFALGAFLVFGCVGVALLFVIQGDSRTYEEGSAETHAVFIAASIVRYQLMPADIASGVSPQRQAEITAVLRQRVLLPPVVRVKVWSSTGVILYSDDARLEGQAFNNAEVKEALDGRTISEIEDRSAPENIYERSLAPKLFSSYVPIVVNPARGTTPDAVVEVYQRYDRIQSGIDKLSGHLMLTLGLGLGFLYLLLLPIVLTTLAVHADRARAQLGSQEKSRFLAFMGHELRTPLNSIIGFADLLQAQRGGDLNDRQARQVTNIQVSGRQLLGVINELLDFSRAEAGQLKVAREEVELAGLVGLVVEQLHPATEAAGITLGHEVDWQCRASADRNRLQQVVTNLANNAVKFTPAGGSVMVRGRSQDGWVELTVTDTGTGIPASALDRIFEPFVRVEGERGEKEGAGLGLSLSRKLVEAMGGTISVESILGSGSTFTVRLRST